MHESPSVPPPDLRDFFPATPESVRDVRHLVTQWADGAGIDRHLAALVAGELATNAYRHTRTSGASDKYSVEVSWDGREFRIAVGDSSPRRPVARQAGADDECGRGLWIIESLGGRITTEDLVCGGKRVVAIFARGNDVSVDGDG